MSAAAGTRASEREMRERQALARVEALARDTAARACALGNGDPGGWCQDASRVLAVRLAVAGVRADLLGGTFTVDRRPASPHHMATVLRVSHRADGRPTADHWWLEIPRFGARWRVDATVGQFAPYLDDPALACPTPSGEGAGHVLVQRCARAADGVSRYRGSLFVPHVSVLRSVTDVVARHGRIADYLARLGLSQDDLDTLAARPRDPRTGGPRLSPPGAPGDPADAR